MHAADENENGDAKTTQNKPVERRKSESGNAKPRATWTKELSGKRKGVGMEETTRGATIDKPIRETMFVTTDENIMGGLKCSLFGLELCNTMTKSTRLQILILGYLRLNSLFRRWTILRHPRGPRRRSKWSLVRSFHTPIPVIRSLALLLNGLRGAFRTRGIPFSSRVCQSPQRFQWYPTSVPQRETPGPPLAHPHRPKQLVSSLSRSCACSRPRHSVWVNRRTSSPLCHVP